MKGRTKEEYNEYMKEYMLKRYHQRRAEIISLLGGVCTSCGSTDELEIDHKDPTEKEFNLSRKLHTLSKEKLDEEVAKCQLLCDKCHNEKSVGEKGQTIARGTHGTISSFRYCKCDLCREANNKWMREYKRRRKEQGSVTQPG